MRDAIIGLPASRIRALANAGLGRTDVLAFWFGESDEVTPAVVRQAAIQSLEKGETFYAHNLGLPSLREAIANEMQTRHGGQLHAGQIAVTSGGVNALMLAMQALVNPGDEVLVVTPVWPNLTAQPVIVGAQLKTLCLKVTSGRWHLPMDALLDAITPHTRLLVINSPNNPTGWTLTREEQVAILARCRQTGTWLLADEVYEQLYYLPSENRCAPSFLDIAHSQDRLVVAHSFSKGFLMTGWRLGWLVMPESMTEHMGKLIEFNTSCASVFVQRAGEVALAHAQDIVPPVVAHMRACRDLLCQALAPIPGVVLAEPPGGMYAFFSIQGLEDDFETAKRWVAEAGLGLAPGSAFDDNAKGWYRWCFASRDSQRLLMGVHRLNDWLSKL